MSLNVWLITLCITVLFILTLLYVTDYFFGDVIRYGILLSLAIFYIYVALKSGLNILPILLVQNIIIYFFTRIIATRRLITKKYRYSQTDYKTFYFL